MGNKEGDRVGIQILTEIPTKFSPEGKYHLVRKANLT